MNTNLRKHVELSEFIKKIVNLHFSDCYGIQIHPETPRDVSFNW